MQKIIHTHKGISLALLILLTLLITACGSATVTEEAPVSTEGEVVDESPAASVEEIVVEEEEITTQPTPGQSDSDSPRQPQSNLQLELTEETAVSNTNALGEIGVEYPVSMLPGTSDFVELAIAVPEQLVSLDPLAVERILVSDAQIERDNLATDQAIILIYESMRVELSSPTLTIDAQFPDTQGIDINTPNNPTFWAWTLVAPNQIGPHIFTIRIFESETAVVPSWLRAYQIEVVSPNPTPQPTPTATPIPSFSQRLSAQISDNSFDVFLAFISLLGSFIAATWGLYRQHQNRQDTISDLYDDLSTTSDERTQTKLQNRLTKLETTRWWEFWK